VTILLLAIAFVSFGWAMDERRRRAVADERASRLVASSGRWEARYERTLTALGVQSEHVGDLRAQLASAERRAGYAEDLARVAVGSCAGCGDYDGPGHECPAEPTEECPCCAGSGEGAADGTTCPACRGHGERPPRRDR